MGLRHILANYLPSWLGDQNPTAPSWGYRTLAAAALLVDGQIQVVLEASLAAVGRGTPTALKYLALARGVTRGRLDTDETFGDKLATWIDLAKARGGQRGLARELAGYLGESRVRVINRAGHWVTVDADGTLTETDAAFDWDSVSHPERAEFLAEQFIVVYSPPAWIERPLTLGDLTGADGYAIGHLVTPQEKDAVLGIVDRAKAAHTMIRAVIFTTDAARFDPTVPASCPDGTWGAWGTRGNGSRTKSGRDLTSCRFWEPR